MSFIQKLAFEDKDILKRPILIKKHPLFSKSIKGLTMKGAIILKRFIAGVVFATTVMPILDSMASAIMTGLEVVKGKWTVKISEYNSQIQKMSSEPGVVHAIGFGTPTEEDEYDDD